MPWKVEKTDSCPASKPWGVVNTDTGDSGGRCHPDRDSALKQMAVLYVKKKNGEMKDAALAEEIPDEVAPELWEEMMAAVVASAP